MDNVDNLSVAHSIFNCTEKPRTCVAKMNPPFAIGLLHKNDQQHFTIFEVKPTAMFCPQTSSHFSN